ncbi:hypothetical protein CEXT_421401 [Caerostris extrusa]|uniref:Uncharacterized protein n=1 Tax=Caerostris extrusa TaxID=172846 RepID=A0AAV4S955_CAEEX|nr:hypothetical protein CEXT_421401 [Caerostris extrusa]
MQQKEKIPTRKDEEENKYEDQKGPDTKKEYIGEKAQETHDHVDSYYAADGRCDLLVVHSGQRLVQKNDLKAWPLVWLMICSFINLARTISKRFEDTKPNIVPPNLKTTLQFLPPNLRTSLIKYISCKILK